MQGIGRQRVEQRRQQREKDMLLAELQGSLDSLRRNEAAYKEAVEEFAVQRLIYEHAAIVCRVRSVLRDLRGR